MATKRKAVTTADLCKAAGVDRRTIYRWRALGLLPAARRASLNGRGSRNYFPFGTLRRVRWIVGQRRRGVSITQLARIVREQR